MKSTLSFLPCLLLLGLQSCATHPVTPEKDAEIKDAIALKKPGFARCAALHANGKMAVVTIAYNTNFVGDFLSVTIDESEGYVSNPKLDECLLEEFKKVKFPASTNGIWGHQRLKFGD